ncbi:sporulation histidine kinase inhibitor Sda [Cohnella xylanilytica]|uniref:Sporulation histidine kinase inhibitor Sda n=1 Tax=Cohnella xylanilytica TaxID=557555 RepID=A0A841TS25_9BACL|nr:sporulation histidine kinase inhibitor Sda [Cohnella xylanilytica]
MTLLQDEHLIESYAEAQSLNLDPNFLDMLRSEILRRGILNLVECDN